METREFKFRAYHPVSGVKEFGFEDIQAMHPDYTEDFTRGCVLFPDGDWRPLSDCEVVQSTGLTDKEGKQIWESDMVCFNVDDECSLISPVVWDEGGFSVKVNKNYVPFLGECWGIQVVGNIHDPV